MTKGEDPPQEKMVLQKDGFPYEKYKPKFKKVHQEKL